jgi:hypothetical protein
MADQERKKAQGPNRKKSAAARLRFTRTSSFHQQWVRERNGPIAPPTLYSRINKKTLPHKDA